MCGICGFGEYKSVRPGNSDLLARMNNTLQHRGPDDAGLYVAPGVGLAMRRLSIIDLAGGHQPLCNEDKTCCIVFNGELYNYLDLRSELAKLGHTFRTASDTEVVLEAYRAWGADCLSRLNGMFAFCVYDSVARQLFLARDRAGEKPLFYYHQHGRLVFASENKALLADPAFPRELDLQALDFYLAYGYVPGEMCILKGVRKLAQGHAMTYCLETDALRVWRYWQLPEPPPPNDTSAEDLAVELETLLEDSVRRQLVADVPTGILLSGGLDSSLVTAMAARVSSQPVKTFTVSFRGHEKYDEGPYARQVAQYFGTEHTELPGEAMTVDLLPELAQQYDEPIADSSMVPTYLVSKLIRQHATVALGGDGGDELFGGYPHYTWIQRAENLKRFVPRPLRAWAGTIGGKLLPVGVKGRNHLIGFSDGQAHSVAHINLYFDAHSRRQLLSPALGIGKLSALSPESYKSALCPIGRSPLQQATSVDFMTYLVDDLLVKVDRASMLTSLEVRAPWLDYRIVEFAFGRVPDRLKATEKQRKILLRHLGRRVLPPGMDLDRKQGFSIPLTSWFQGDWGRFIESVLSDSELFDRRTIRKLIAAQHRGFANTHRLFALTMFELWRRHYRISIPV